MTRKESAGVVRSVAAPENIGATIAAAYDLGAEVECRLHAVNVHEHYLVRAGERRYVFRVYNRHNFWANTESAYRFELDLMTHLHDEGAPVVRPMRRRDGDCLSFLEAPEGKRGGALFSWASGQPAYPPSRVQSYNLGVGVASVHLAADRFESRHARVRFDLELLLEGSLRRILPYLEKGRTEDRKYLEGLADRLRARMAGAPMEDGAFGVIGGGFEGTNNHYDAEGGVTFFNFDFCGYGWRAYDPAVFLFQARLYEAPEESWTAFVEGYQSRRPLTRTEIDLIPTLLMLKMIFTMSYHLSFSIWMGDASFDDFYWDRHFVPLRAWEDMKIP